MSLSQHGAVKVEPSVSRQPGRLIQTFSTLSHRYTKSPGGSPFFRDDFHASLKRIGGCTVIFSLVTPGFWEALGGLGVHLHFSPVNSRICFGFFMLVLRAFPISRKHLDPTTPKSVRSDGSGRSSVSCWGNIDVYSLTSNSAYFASTCTSVITPDRTLPGCGGSLYISL